jgi:hypothetical protein
MLDKELTEEEQLSISAQDAHNLMEMCQTAGWKFLEEFYFKARLKQCKDYLYNDKNNDPVMIRAKVMMMDFIETMLAEITQQIEIGMENEIELKKRKKKSASRSI